jgi:hypothetical protein
MSTQLGPFARKQRLALLGFYISGLAFAIAIGLAERLAQVYRLSLLSLAVLIALLGAFSLFQFFRTTDEFRLNINHWALEFAFIGTLIAAVGLALPHSFGVRSVSPYALPALMIILWSIGLFFSARRYE